MTGATALSQTAKTDGTCAICRQNALAAASSPVSADGRAAKGQPINIATGNMYEQVTDYTTIGTNPLALTRTYNSMSYSRGLYPTLVGPNWRTNYDRYLRSVSSSLVTAERPDGRVINFKLVSSVWTPDTDVDVKLTNSGSTYTLTDSDDTVEVYTVASGKGTLNSITLPNGYVQTLNYTSGVLTSVSDSYSRSLSFTYTSGMLTGVTTPDSATLTYGYTTVLSQSLLTSITYNTSPSTSQTYVYANTELPFALTSITDENGNTNSQWTYDGAGRCTMSEHAGGADEVQVSYDDSTGYRTVTDPLGNAETYHFTTLQGVSKVSSIVRAANSPVAAATRTFTYDANGYLATATDWDGNSTHWTNNSHGLPTSITEAYGTGRARTTSITYDSTWVHKPYTTTKTNVTIDDRYNASTGTLTSHTLTDTTGGTTNGDTEVWAYTYNGTGEMLTETFPRTGTTVKNTYTYSSGALASVTDQLSHAITISTANGTGQPTKILDANSVETDFVYDNRNRLTSKTVKATPSNEVTTSSYIGSGQPYVTTFPDSSTLTRTYDNAQRLTKIANTAGETINYTLDAMGDITAYAAKDSGGTTRKSWTATYDVLGDMLTRVGAGGGTQTTTYTYDGNKNRLSVEDANSKTTSLAWDELNRPTTVTDPNSNTAAPTYNNLDQITAQTDFNGYSTSYTRDAFGNAIKRVSPDTGTVNNTFDEDNNLTGRTDARSVVSAQTFDAADRLTATTFTGYSGEAIAYTYDSTSGGNVGIGRLTSFSDESGSTTQKFDNFGNITSSVRVIGTQTYTTSYSYDLANRLTEIIYPSGRYVDYTFDSSGYLTTVTTKPSSGGTVTTLASSITHKPFGPIVSFTYGNSEAQTRTFDNNYWLTALNTVYSGTYVQELSFTQDYAGNYTAITDTLDSTRNESFGVDSLNRLHTASGKYGSRTYTYDNNSNRSTWYDGTITRTSSFNSGTNTVASITDGTNTRHLTWTASGNIASDDRVMNGAVAASMTYGGRDRLESIVVGTPTVTFKVNALGQRVQKATTGATTDYSFDLAGHVIGEADDSTGSTTTEYVFMEGELLAQIDSSGNIYYAHNSQVSAAQKMTDASRTLVFDRIQEPFGEDSSTPTNTDPTNHRFPGQYADAEDLLNQNNNREYDPTIGYIEADPSGFRGGLNLYAYAGQNPTEAIDPFGLAYFKNYLDPNKNPAALYQWAESYQPNMNIIIAHSTSNGMFADSDNPKIATAIDPVAAAQDMMNDSSYDPSVPTEVIVCSGANNDAVKAFAKTLGGTVWAPTTDITYPIYLDTGNVAEGMPPVKTKAAGGGKAEFAPVDADDAGDDN
jgi:RHS repeat-associated protein